MTSPLNTSENIIIKGSGEVKICEPHSLPMKGKGGKCLLLPSRLVRPFRELEILQLRDTEASVPGLGQRKLKPMGVDWAPSGQRIEYMNIFHRTDAGHMGKEAAQKTFKCCLGGPPGRARGTSTGSISMDQVVNAT